MENKLMSSRLGDRAAELARALQIDSLQKKAAVPANGVLAYSVSLRMLNYASQNASLNCRCSCRKIV